MDPRRIDVEEPFDVRFGSVRNRNDRVRHFEGGLLHPKTEIITAGQLLAFPRPERFERMNRDDERNSVIFLRQNTAEMAVPGVTMHEVGIDVRGIEIEAAAHRAENRSATVRDR